MAILFILFMYLCAGGNFGLEKRWAKEDAAKKKKKEKECTHDAEDIKRWVKDVEREAARMKLWNAEREKEKLQKPVL